MKGVSQSFRDRADSAAFWEAWVGATLTRAGLYVLHYPFKIDGEDHSQSFDFLVSDSEEAMFGSKEFGPRPLEIKSVELTFFNADSYPFQDVLVCSKASFQRKWPGRDYIGRDFLFVSRKTGSVVWLPAMSQVTFGEVTDKSRSETYQAVYANKSQLRELSDFVETFGD